MKKWSYAAAMMLALAGGSIFTGCIDNDEPEGIRVIREATADLLKAKAAVQDAEKAQVEAQIRIAELDAEIKKAQIAAETARAEAEAAVAKIEAEAAAAKTEAEAEVLRAKADAIRMLAEQKCKESQAKIDQFIARTNVAIADAQLALDKLKAQWELQKTEDALYMNDKYYGHVSAAYTAYISQLEYVNLLQKNYNDALNNLAQFENDLVWDGTKFTSPNAGMKEILENAVAEAQGEVDRINKVIDQANEFLAKIDEVKTSSDLSNLLSEYEEKLTQNVQDLAEANVEKSQIWEQHKAEYDAVVKLQEQISAFDEQPIAIPAYTYKPDADLQALGIQEEVIVPAGKTYTLSTTTNYDNYVQVYKNAIASTEMYLLDDNDKMWTQARINEINNKLGILEPVNNKNIKEWNDAKAVYALGKLDASKLALETEVESAINAYNASKDTYKGVFDAVEAAYKTLDEANTAVGDAWDAYYDNATSTSVNATYNRAIQAEKEAKDAADADYNAAKDAALKVQQQTYRDAEKVIEDKKTALARADHAQYAAWFEWQTDLDNASLKAAYESAKATYDTALTAYNGAAAVETATKSAADVTYNKAVAKAYTACVAAKNKANEELDKARAEWVKAGGASADQNDPAFKAYEDALAAQTAANDAYEKATDAIQPAQEKILDLYDAMVTAVNNQLKAITYNAWTVNTIPSESDLNNYLQLASVNPYLVANTNFPVASAPIKYMNQDGEYENAKTLVKDKSYLAYGPLLASYDTTDPFDNDEFFLVDTVTTDMINEYLDAYFKNYYGQTFPDYIYVTLYPIFGSFGEVSFYKNRNLVAQTVIDKNDILNTAVEGFQSELAKLQQTKTDADNAKKALEQQETADQATLAGYTAEADAKIEDLKRVQTSINSILFVIRGGLAQMEALAVNAPNITCLENMKAEAEKVLANNPEELADAEKVLEAAQAQLDTFNNNPNGVVNPYKYQVEYLAANLEAEKTRLNFLSTRLAEVQEAYENATKK